MKNTVSKFPKYMSAVNGSAVCLVGVGKTGRTAKYFRHAGFWNIWIASKEDGSFVCENNKGNMKHANGSNAKECSVKEWRLDNKGYYKKEDKKI